MNSLKKLEISICMQNFILRTWILFFLASFLVIFHNPSMASCATGSITTAETACSFSSGSLSITSSGSISVTGSTVGLTVPNSSTVTAIDNDGTISSASGRAVSNGTGTIGTLTNNGTITSTSNFAIVSAGTITNLTNSSTGTISSTNYGAVASTASGTIGTLTNAGLITTGSLAGTPPTGSQTIRNEGAFTNIVNTSTGTIRHTGAFQTIYNSSSKTIQSIDNAGLITASTAQVIYNDGTLVNVVNSGTISLISASNPTIYNPGAITNFTNTSTGIISSTSANTFVNNGTMGTFSNSGSLTSTGASSTFNNNGAITNITNTSSGIIRNTGTGRGIINNLSSSTIGTLNNAGTISGGTNAAGVQNTGTISTLVNTGTISSITSSGTITTLHNQQGASSSALSYSGTLPTNYNIIVRSSNNYGQIAFTSPSGATTFGIYGGGVSGVDASTLSKGTYRSALTGITSTNLTGATSGSYNGFIWSLNNSSGTIWDLVVTGSTADTQQSLVNNASALQGTFALQNSVLTNSFYYDCAVFDRNNVCISAGGRNTAVSASNGLNNNSALLITAYRPYPNYRIGAYIDQNLSVNNAGPTVTLDNSTPLVGLYGVWSERLDDTGTEVKVSAAYGQKSAAINRQVVGSSDPGNGGSQLVSQGAQVTAKYGYGIADKLIISPYVGIRYTQNNMGGYTEGTSANVTTPLTYSALNTNATTALAGVGTSYRLIRQATVFASAGVETDTNTANGTYSATGISGLTPINFNANPVKTRPTAVLGAYYDVEKNQRVSVTGIYRQESYQAVSTAAVLATYTVGL